MDTPEIPPYGDLGTIVPSDWSGLVVDESGTSEESFSVALTSKPEYNVTLPVDTDDSSVSAVSPDELTFTPSNWGSLSLHTVTVTGVNDHSVHPDTPFSVQLGPAVSKDPSYSGLTPSPIPGLSVDTNQASIVTKILAPANPSEAGGTAEFSVALDSIPLSSVAVSLSPADSSTSSDATLSATSLNFDKANWNMPQTVTVTDHQVDGDVAYTVNLAAASSDTNYNNKDASVGPLAMKNPAIASIVVTNFPTTQISEAGGTDQFSVALSSIPSSAVTVPINVGDPSAVTLSASAAGFDPSNPSLTFDATDWNVPQTVTVTGVNDYTAHGSVSESISLGTATSGDSHYKNLTPSTPLSTLTILDPYTAKFVITMATAAVTTDQGGQASFSVALDSMPTGTVKLPVASSKVADGTVSVSSLSFNSGDWNQPQTVTVTGMPMPGSKSNAAYKVLFGSAAGTKITGTDTSGYLRLTVPALPLVNRVTQSLGTVAYTDIPHPSADAQGYWYRFTAAHTGTLTIQATPADKGAVAITLQDANHNLLSTQDSGNGAQSRIDQQVTANQTYYLEVTGTSTDFDLRLADLVSASGGTVTVYGVSTPETVAFVAGTQTQDLTVNGSLTVNGIGYAFSPTALATLNFTGGGTGSHAVVSLTCSTGPDTLVMNKVGSAVKAGSATLSGMAGLATYTVNILNCGSITVQGGSGAESAALYGVKGNNTLIASPGKADLSGTGYHDYLAGFTTISVSGAAGGKQAASITGSATGTDTFTLTPQTAKVSFAQGQGLTVQAFDYIYAIVGNSSDVADLTASSGNKDTFAETNVSVSVPGLSGKVLGALMSDSATYWNWLDGFSTVSISNPSTKAKKLTNLPSAGHKLGYTLTTTGPWIS
ncbi:MAG: hypothetical protein ACLQNE_08755 [Thermoguttaceae bacterium]